MVPAGYMAKRVISLPTWFPGVSTIYSVSGCVSDNFADYAQYWKHNGYWLFDSPEVIVGLAQANSIDLAGTLLFFYEVFEQQHDGGKWTPFAPQPTFASAVKPPERKQLEGFDVVTYSAQTSPECSPLSCTALATEVPTNSHCLLESFADAHRLIENGAFDDCEPEPHRIFAVYSVRWLTIRRQLIRINVFQGSACAAECSSEAVAWRAAC
jgi:hypothetical protein